MGMSYAEARERAVAAFVAQGMSPEEAAAAVTPADVRLYGFEVGDPTAQVQVGPVLSPEQIREQLALLKAEAESNRWSGVALAAWNKIVGALKSAGTIAVLFALLCAAGCSVQRAQETLPLIERGVIAGDRQHLDFENALIAEKKAKALDEADTRYAEAVASHTATVTVKVPTKVVVMRAGPDGKEVATEETRLLDQAVPYIDARVAAALQAEKARQYAQVAGVEARERDRQAAISANAASALALVQGLREYYGQQAQTHALASQMIEDSTSVLARFIEGKKGAREK